jgi:16S rRNA (uracil1498-N3)-methyltransferase
MPVTPAWPPQSTPRLYVEQPLALGAVLELEGAQAHYLVQVMRLREGAPLKLFDDISGEWLGEVQQVGKRAVVLKIQQHLRPRAAPMDIWLAAAPIRKNRFDWVAEKACELGIAKLIPIMTARGVVDKVKPERLRAQMIEAAEQCNRTSLPVIEEAVALKAFLAGLHNRTLFFADETGGEPMLAAFQANKDAASVLLIGPEGGFTSEERALIMAHKDTKRISLGSHILRAETAALAGLSVLSAVHNLL